MRFFYAVVEIVDRVFIHTHSSFILYSSNLCNSIILYFYIIIEDYVEKTIVIKRIPIGKYCV